jgi:antitoxin (DNA-binding transcriptional repressor) of toxin-antitoxin stability system
MRTVGLKVLKNRLSEYVRIAANGETVLIADRDRVVAELVPPQEGRSLILRDAQLAGMVREGLLTPPIVGSGAPARPPPVATYEELAHEFEADRTDR